MFNDLVECGALIAFPTRCPNLPLHIEFYRLRRNRVGVTLFSGCNTFICKRKLYNNVVVETRHMVQSHEDNMINMIYLINEPMIMSNVMKFPKFEVGAVRSFTLRYNSLNL